MDTQQHLSYYEENDSRSAKVNTEADINGNKELLNNGKLCFLCTEKSLPDRDCKVCLNIRLYHSKNANDVAQNENISFPGPGIIKRNHIYGNYVVASRPMEEGEVIIVEKPMTMGPYGPPDVLPLCLSCCRDIGLSSKCSKCKWPVCGTTCEQSPLHSQNECEYFRKSGIRSKQELNEYFGVETLRALLLRDRNVKAWKRIMEFEPHFEARRNDYKAKLVTDFIINFIRNKCNFGEEFSSETIEHVVGVLSINTFWAFKELKRYASCLFDKITLFAHDCDPNTNRNLIFSNQVTEEEAGYKNAESICMQVTAARRIEEGEMITIRYINVDKPFLTRRGELKETFYFECTCSRCLRELNELENVETVLSISEISLN